MQKSCTNIPITSKRLELYTDHVSSIKVVATAFIHRYGKHDKACAPFSVSNQDRNISIPFNSALI